MSVTVYPVVMAGGAGTRLWPLSTSQNPKQFRRLLGDRSLFQETLSRVTGEVGHVRFAPPSIIAGVDYETLAVSQLDEQGLTPHKVLLEPFGRNTAAVAAMAAAIPDDDSALVLLLPSDHYMADPAAFRAAIETAAEPTLQRGLVTTFGIDPTHPETGYGYIRRGSRISTDLFDCDAFVEKPNLETALSYLSDGNYAWNGGIFLFQAGVMKRELAQYAPTILDATLQALEEGETRDEITTLNAERFAGCPSDSIDYAVMEKTEHAAVYGPLRCGWSDIGSWSALAALDPADAHGDVIDLDTRDCYLRSEDGTLIAAVGIEGLVVIASGESVLVAPKARVQEVKAIVGALKQSGRTEKL